MATMCCIYKPPHFLSEREIKKKDLLVCIPCNLENLSIVSLDFTRRESAY